MRKTNILSNKFKLDNPMIFFRHHYGAKGVASKGVTIEERVKGSIDNFGPVDLFLGLTLLYVIAVYSLSLSIIIFKIITKSCKIFLKLTIQGHQPQQKVV